MCVGGHSRLVKPAPALPVGGAPTCQVSPAHVPQLPYLSDVSLSWLLLVGI